MLANFLNKSKPINFIGLIIFFFTSFLIDIFTDGFSSEKILKTFILSLQFLSIFLIYNFIIGKNRLTHDNSFAYFIFILLNLSILSKLGDYKTLSLTIIYLLFIRKIYSLRSNKIVFEKLFDSGFWLGIFFILEPLSIFLFILIYLASYLHSKITIHTLLIPILGFITPLTVYFTYLFWTEQIIEFTNLFQFKGSFNIQIYSGVKYKWMVNSIFILTIFTVIIKSIKTLSVNNTFKKSWILLICNFFVLVFFLLFLPNKNGSELIYILIPVSIILANGIELIQKTMLKNIILYTFLLGSILINYFL